jgi:hypothetical protein
MPSFSKHVDAAKDCGSHDLSVETATIDEIDDCRYAGLNNKDTQCAVISAVQAQNAVPPLRELALSHDCISPVPCQLSFNTLVERVHNQQPFTMVASSSKGTRATLERVAKAKAPSIVRYDNEEVYRLTKKIKFDLLKVSATVQVDLAELVVSLFTSFCEVGYERLLKLAGYRSLRINRCLTCEEEWTKVETCPVLHLYVERNDGNASTTLEEVFRCAAKPGSCGSNVMTRSVAGYMCHRVAFPAAQPHKCLF